MIRVFIPGLYASDFSSSKDQRSGDCTIINDYIGETNTIGNVDVVDGGCGKMADRVIKRLKTLKIKSPYLHITHFHYDHYFGIRKIINDKWFTPKALYCQDPNTIDDVSSDVKENKRVVKTIISEAKARGIKVIYLKNGDTIQHGNIYMKVYRDNNVSYRGNSDAYLNDGSLCYWLSILSYLTTGDADLGCANRYGLHPTFIKIGHHGNDVSGYNLKPSEMAPWLKRNGCLYCWDNDYSTKLTNFLNTGREDCLTAKMTYFNCHGDINFVAYGGKVVIYKGGKNYQYPCSYKGKSRLKMADLKIVEAVLKGEYGNDESRVTALIDAGYYPSNVQNWINKLRKLFVG